MGKLCTYCHFSYAKHFVSAANLIICSILAPSDTVAKGVEVGGGSVGKRRPVLQSVQLNDFNARFFGALGTCHLARYSLAQLNCLHPFAKVSLCLFPFLSFFLHLSGIFSQSLHFAINIRNCNWQHTREPWLPTIWQAFSALRKL